MEPSEKVVPLAGLEQPYTINDFEVPTHEAKRVVCYRSLLENAHRRGPVVLDLDQG